MNCFLSKYLLENLLLYPSSPLSIYYEIAFFILRIVENPIRRKNYNKKTINLTLVTI